MRCATCCFSSGPEGEGSMTLEQLLLCVRQAALVPSIRQVGFTGEGEPMLLWRELLEAMRLARSLGLSTSLVTGGYWGEDARGAAERLDSLAGAGLARFCLSFDDAHAEFVSFEAARRLLEGALERGIREVCLLTVVGARSHWTPQRLALALGPALAARVELRVGPVHAAGRARALDARDRLPEGSPFAAAADGPCAQVLDSLSVGVGGELYACCATLEDRSYLRLGNVFKTPLFELAARAMEDPLWRWIAEEGPCAVGRALQAAGRPAASRPWDSICDACRSIVGDPALSEAVARLARGRRTAP